MRTLRWPAQLADLLWQAALAAGAGALLLGAALAAAAATGHSSRPLADLTGIAITLAAGLAAATLPAAAVPDRHATAPDDPATAHSNHA